MNEAMPAERSYIAFISYRHTPLDREAAERVQKKIENFIVPKEFREQVGGKKLGMCFRDEDELPASSSLTDSIYYALDHTKFLIVICTPDLPLSKWCEAEIKYFLKTHDRDHLLAVLADGTPDVSFSPYMLHDFDEEGNITKDWEPLAANIAGENHTINNKAFKKEIVRLYAAMIGCPFDELWQRERRARTNRLLTAAAAAVVVMAVFLGVVLNRNAKIEAQNTQILEQNTQILAQNDQITEQKNEIEEKNRSLQQQLSTALVDSGISKLEGHDIKGALTDGLAAVESDVPDLYDSRAKKLLADALGAYSNQNIRCELVYEQSTDIAQLSVTDDEKYALLLDSVGVIRCLDLSDYSVCWETTTDDPYTRIYTKHVDGCILLKSKTGLYCHSAKDGALLWSHEHPENCETYFQAISEDGSLFALLDQAPEGNAEESPLSLVFLNTSDGTEIGRTSLSTEGYTINTGTFYADYSFGGVFSEDNSQFFAAFPVKEDASNNNCTAFYRIDLPTCTCTLIDIYLAWMDKFYGAFIDPEADSIYTASLYLEVGGISTDLWTRGQNNNYDVQNTIVSHKVSTLAGYDPSDEFRIGDCRWLTNNDLVYLFSDNQIFVYDRIRNKLLNNYSLTGTIINAYWLNKDAGLAEVACSDGYFIDYQFDPTGTYVVKGIYGENISQDNLSKACPIAGGFLNSPGEGSALVVSKDYPGRLLNVKRISDPNRQLIDLSLTNQDYMDKLAVPEGLNQAFCFYNGNSAVTFDKQTMEIKEKAVFNDAYFFSESLPIDETHFLNGETQYSMDGKDLGTYGDPLNVKNAFFSMHYYPTKHLRLSDGQILSWYSLEIQDPSLKEEYKTVFSGDGKTHWVPFWLNGEIIPETKDKKSRLLFYYTTNESDVLVSAGESGLAMAYGMPVLMDGDSPVISEKPAFRFLNALSGETYLMDNPYPDSGSFLTAFGHRNQWMAAAFEDGTVCIFEPGKGSVNALQKKYAANEIAALCYSSDDSYLLVLTNSGTLDVYDTASSELLSEQSISCLSDLIREEKREFNTLQADFSEDHADLFLTASTNVYSYGIVLDPKAWTVTETVGEIYAYDPDTRQIFCPSSGVEYDRTKLYSYPAYTLQDLKVWAAEVLKNG